MIPGASAIKAEIEKKEAAAQLVTEEIDKITKAEATNRVMGVAEFDNFIRIQNYLMYQQPANLEDATWLCRTIAMLLLENNDLRTRLQKNIDFTIKSELQRNGFHLKY